MIAAVIAASLVSPVSLPPAKSSQAAPCHAVPSLCLTAESDVARPLWKADAPASDTKMSAYRFDARPCRVIGNMGCPKQARLKLFRLGEPLRETLLRTFGPR